MKKFLNTVAGRYTIFGLILFVVVLGISMVEAHYRIQAEFSDTQVTITSNRYTMTVRYDLIESIELVDMPDRGEHVDGKDDINIRYGIWNNDTWGEYYVCAIPNATNCIVMHLNDGRTFVFNARSNDYTADLFAELESHLAS